MKTVLQVKFAAISFLQLFVAEQSYAGDVRLEPFSCFGSACDPRGAEPLTLPFSTYIERECFYLDGHIASVPIDSPVCQPTSIWGPPPIRWGASVEFALGSRPTAEGTNALFTLKEMEKSIKNANPVVQLGYDLKFKYKTCPWNNFNSMGVLQIGCNAYEPGKGIVGVALKERSVAYSETGQGEISISDFENIDLSKCATDLTVVFRSGNLCEVDVRLFEITIH